MKAKHSLSRRLLPLFALTLTATACNEAATDAPAATPPATAAPLAAEPAPLAPSDPAPLAPTEPAAAAPGAGTDPGATLAAVELGSAGRTIVRASIGCQEWNPGAPPQDIECPAELENGEVIRFLTSTTCARSGMAGREAQLPCPEVKRIAR